MIKPATAPSLSDPFAAAPLAPAPEPDPRPPAPPKAEAEPNVRLTIDASPDGPYFVYTLQDRASGRIIAQLPRHKAAELGESPDYQTGDLIRAKA